MQQWIIDGVYLITIPPKNKYESIWAYKFVDLVSTCAFLGSTYINFVDLASICAVLGSTYIYSWISFPTVGKYGLLEAHFKANHHNKKSFFSSDNRLHANHDKMF